MVMRQMMNDIESAAMWRDARVLDHQARIILKHLRFHFNHKITVPFGHIVTLLDGYTRPWMKVFDCSLPVPEPCFRGGEDHQGSHVDVQC